MSDPRKPCYGYISNDCMSDIRDISYRTFCKEKSANKGRNGNAVVTNTVNTVLVAKNVEVANSSLEKRKDVMNHIKIKDEINDSNIVSQSMKKVSRIEKSVAKKKRVAEKAPIVGNVIRIEGRKQISRKSGNGNAVVTKTKPNCFFANDGHVTKSTLEKGNAVKVEDEIDDNNNVSQNMKKVSQIEKLVVKNTHVANKKPVGGNVLRTKGRKQTVLNNIVSNEVREESYMGNNVYVWEGIIENANSKARSVLHFSRIIAKKCLKQNQKKIKLVDVKPDKTFKSAVHTDTRKNMSNRYEKYMAQRSYEYVKSKNLWDEDALVLKMGPFSPYLYATFKRD
ncbi:hypothetical protein KIW84_021509 [Lathyrus oleraceus]|uniref:Uncharacterized protein n=1 Tax=Pisum sativum TaxID=3888 RepID=A0A9D5BA08_PEA|nr:hypothetical protein KIW84_021509 [Pisum sativum]